MEIIITLDDLKDAAKAVPGITVQELIDALGYLDRTSAVTLRKEHPGISDDSIIEAVNFFQDEEGLRGSIEEVKSGH